MTFYDLNIPYNEPNEPGITNTLRFLSEVGYTTVALSQSITGRLPAVVSPLPLPTNVPPSITLLTRLNITLSDSTQNQRLAALAQSYSLIAIRPMNEKTLSQACNSLDCDIISLDLSTRLPYHFKFKTLSAAISRGVRLEICYGPGVTGSGLEARRNLIGNAAALIRAARGRGIIISSEAKQALGIRAPWDVVNLACVWGMKSERAKEAVSEEARKVVDMARVKRTSFRGTVDVIYGGEEDEGVAKKADQGKKAGKKPGTATFGVSDGNGVKRKASLGGTDSQSTPPNEPQLSKREIRRRAKKAKLLSADTSGAASPAT
ncbi:RNA-binding RNA processing protein rpp1 [Microsporum audouinii]